jgi:hypothetical protein
MTAEEDADQVLADWAAWSLFLFEMIHLRIAFMSTIKGSKSNLAYQVYYVLQPWVYCVVLAGVIVAREDERSGVCATVGQQISL